MGEAELQPPAAVLPWPNLPRPCTSSSPSCCQFSIRAGCAIGLPPFLWCGGEGESAICVVYEHVGSIRKPMEQGHVRICRRPTLFSPSPVLEYFLLVLPSQCTGMSLSDLNSGSCSQTVLCFEGVLLVPWVPLALIVREWMLFVRSLLFLLQQWWPMTLLATALYRQGH